MTPLNPAAARTGARNPAQAASPVRDALEIVRPYLRRSMLFTSVATIFSLAPSAYMLEVYGRVVDSRNHMTLLMLTVAVLLAYLLMEVLEWVHHHEMHDAGLALDKKMSERVFRGLFEARLKRLPAGSAQPLNDLKTLREFLPSQVLQAIFQAPTSMLFLVLLFAIHPILGWSALVGTLVQVLIAWFNQRTTQEPLMQANRSAMAAQQYADGSLRNAQVIEAMGMLRDIHLRWIKRQREFLGLQARASDAAGTFSALSKLVQMVWSSLLLGLGAWLLLQGQLNGGGGMMIVGSILGGLVLRPLVQIITQWRVVVNARDAWRRLDGLLLAIPEPADAMPLPAPSGRLSAENLLVVAPGSQSQLLRGVNFTLNPGEVLAVIGPSAAGKTCLARALTGIWPSLGGKVRLDGADVHAWNKEELGPHVGYLPQDIELFDGTIAENIARFGNVDRAAVEQAARSVGLHDFIVSLPQGYDTDVGPAGARLSGGQRQRVGLARALYGSPVFVVLDEPNSSLDDAGDAALAQAIAAAKSRGTTFVVITHRTSVLGVADKMMLLRDGAQQAFGSRDEVLAALNKASQQAAQGRGGVPAPGGAARALQPQLAPADRTSSTGAA
jgi:ATP-binding cassette subfamily C exporter for protease/lipase